VQQQQRNDDSSPLLHGLGGFGLKNNVMYSVRKSKHVAHHAYSSCTAAAAAATLSLADCHVS
jgi:hypothetical protein